MTDEVAKKHWDFWYDFLKINCIHGHVCSRCAPFLCLASCLSASMSEWCQTCGSRLPLHESLTCSCLCCTGPLAAEAEFRVWPLRHLLELLQHGSSSWGSLDMPDHTGEPKPTLDEDRANCRRRVGNACTAGGRIQQVDVISGATFLLLTNSPDVMTMVKLELRCLCPSHLSLLFSSSLCLSLGVVAGPCAFLFLCTADS